ncbi:MAG: YkgJ family cysteine cluster protein [Candidatus Nanoarchaeia archaeon]|nr:YkgJ family cysteine cluster protein [Candidatus Nanoarchaeia archaeon]
MKSNFQCLNCGKCCNSYYAQINITIGDIIRISDFMKKPISYILKNFIGINAFGDPENPEKFSYEFGINMPCALRKDEKCSVYQARPLNCRLFPYWVLVHASKSGSKDFIDDSYKCMSGINLNEKELKKYDNYVKVIGEALMEEGEFTDKILDDIQIMRSVDLQHNQDYKKIAEKYKDVQKPEDFKKLEEEKIRLAKEIFSELDDHQISLIEEKAKNPDLVEKIKNNTEKIQDAEKILD